jgi:hypothetical protein
LRERRLSLCKAVIEHGQVIAGLNDPAPGEMGEDASPHDLHQVADFLGAKAWQGVEDGLAVGLFHVHSVHEQSVPVRV